MVIPITLLSCCVGKLYRIELPPRDWLSKLVTLLLINTETHNIHSSCVSDHLLNLIFRSPFAAGGKFPSLEMLDAKMCSPVLFVPKTAAHCLAESNYKL